MDKVRRIVHPKLKPFHFQIKTYYLSDANYPGIIRLYCENSQCVIRLIVHRQHYLQQHPRLSFRVNPP